MNKYAFILLLLGAAGVHAAGPSFPCGKVEKGGVPALVCSDAELSALDVKMAAVYRLAANKAANQHPPVLKAEQRGWIKGRDECWKSADVRTCVRDEYRYRIAALQASYRLVPGVGPKFMACDGDPRNEVLVTYFATDPPVLIAERGDEVSLMTKQADGSYLGRNETLQEAPGGAAIVVWGYQAPEMRCAPKP